MGESTYGLIVEGIYDEAVFTELLGRIVSPQPVLVVRSCGGLPHLINRFPGFLYEFKYVMEGKAVDKALVICDCDGRDTGALERKLSARFRSLSVPFPVHFCTVKQTLDTWLMADAVAINSVAQRRGGRAVAEVQGELEDILDPKEKFKRLLSLAGLPYTAALCREIAALLRLEMLRYRCPSFRAFEKKVIGD